MRNPRLILLGLLASLLAAVTSRADGPASWTGVWDVSWINGGAHMNLTQEGASVKGEVPLFGARIEGTVDGARLNARRLEGDRSYQLTLTIRPDGNAFIGRDEVGGWCTAVRLSAVDAPVAPRLATPREALGSFLRAATFARMGVDEQWTLAARAAQFTPEALAFPPTLRIRLLRAFFDLVDLTTFDMVEIADDVSQDEVTLQLRQSRSDARLPVTIRRDRSTGEWRVVIPGEDEILALRKPLLAIYGSDPPTGQSFQQLRSARDAVRTFLEGMANWEGRGRALALSTLDLRAIPDALQQADGELAAGFLCRALYRLGVGLHSISDDPKNRDPVVLFEHPTGSIVVAPTGPEADAPWKFTEATVDAIPRITHVLADIHPAQAPPLGVIPETTYFRISAAIDQRAPRLQMRILGFTAWQLIAVALVATLAIGTARILSRAIADFLRRKTGSLAPLPPWTQLSILIPLALAILAPFPEMLGIPHRFLHALLPPAGSAATIGAALVAWHLLTVGSRIALLRMQRSPTPSDVLSVNLLLGCTRVGILVGAFVGVAYWWSMPGTHVLAGLGIGGLGIAFASQQTIAQFFGAGVIVGDRPFRVGDWIQCSGSATGTLSGVVESVGLRSTRVRSADGSTLSVPNSALATSTITNLGPRRPRSATLQVTVTEGATLERVERFIATLRERIAANAAFLTGRTTVGVSGIARDGIQVQCVVWLDVLTDQEETDARHALLVDILAIAAAQGLGLGPQFARPAPSTDASDAGPPSR